MITRPAFVRLPSRWIEERGLWSFAWGRRGEGVDSLTALMVLTALTHRLEPADGSVRMTYTEIAEVTGLARKSVSRGLDFLSEQLLIEREPRGRSTFQIENYDPNAGWAAFPVRTMYRNDVIHAFTDFKKRQQGELDALKFFFLCVARRDRNTNTANITYDKICEYSGIQARNLKRAISTASTLGLIYVDQVLRGEELYGVVNAYRIAGINPRHHVGTRSFDAMDFVRGDLVAPWNEPR